MGGCLDPRSMRRSLHFILHVCLSFDVAEAVKHNPHSFRHFLIESGQQLRALKVCSTDDMERLGRWSKGSAMQDTYDNAAGVSELMARHTVLQALRSGWRPVPEGHLPVQLPSSSLALSSSSSPTFVAHTGYKKVHAKHSSLDKTVCGTWCCGNLDCPAKNAQFTDISELWTRCKPCLWTSGV